MKLMVHDFPVLLVLIAKSYGNTLYHQIKRSLCTVYSHVSYKRIKMLIFSKVNLLTILG